MRILVAPNAFKESLSAREAAEAVARGLERGMPGCDLVLCPLADGGDGTAEALAVATGGRMLTHRVAGPLGDPVEARWALLGDGTTACIEMAEASGLRLLPPERRNPLVTTTRGTGELLLAALDVGVQRIIVGVGGSATVDGGSGLARALGYRFLDEEGREVPEGGAGLLRLARIDASGADPRLAQVDVVVACDVENPLLGDRGAAKVFAPQKGASPEDVELLEAALARFAQVVERDMGVDVAGIPGAGAAGGLPAGLVAFCGARCLPGAQVVMEAVGFDRLLGGADLVVTGEGALDASTAHGKAPAAVARAAARAGVPVVALAGALLPGYEALRGGGLTAAFACTRRPASVEEAMASAAAWLEATAEELGRLLRAVRS